MSEREKPWWETDVTRVLSEVNDFYERVEKLYPDKGKIPFTKKKIIEVRGWAPTTYMFEAHFDAVLKQLGFVYIPNRVKPGPTFIFPILDVDGNYTCAQTKPSEGSVLCFSGMKYRYIGGKPIGPRWLGMDAATIKKIMELRKVVVVEGGFDLLAARLMAPDIPIVSPLTKKLGWSHLMFLRMLSVTEVLLMYDNEEAKTGRGEGAGNVSMEQQIAAVKTMKLSALICPKSDPSTCLQNPDSAKKLRERLLCEFQ